MVVEWLLEFMKSIGRFFLNPLFYYFIILTMIIGFFRIKRERRTFHVRVYDFLHEFRALFLASTLVIGCILSIFSIAIGIVLPLGTIFLIGCIMVIISLTGRLRLLSPAYSLSLSFFCVIFLSRLSIDEGFFARVIADIKSTDIRAFALLIGFFLIAEGWLIFRKGHEGSSPAISKSKRGLPIGNHFANRLWMLPIFLLVPGDVLSTNISWWPLLTVGGERYSLFLVPFGVGFYQRIKSGLPVRKVKITGKMVILHGLTLLIAAGLSILYPVLAIVVASLAIIGRELIYLQLKITDESKPNFFTKKEKGLLILGVIPKSPAHKMGLKVGEVITKVNGIKVFEVRELYQSLQKNRAFCKLEVENIEGEIRFVQRSLYDGEHHELGILFVDDYKKWEHEAV